MNDAPTILLVDDDNVLRDVLGRVLTRDGYTVVPAAGVAEALELAGEHTLSLALVDLSLPDGDGVGLADSLRERQADLPLILMTAYPIRLREDPEIGSRFRRVMIKPLNLDELRARRQRGPARRTRGRNGESLRGFRNRPSGRSRRAPPRRRPTCPTTGRGRRAAGRG